LDSRKDKGMSVLLVNANSLHIPLADNSVQCVVTSPPYYGLRDYQVDGQIGLEQTPDEYVANMVAVFREVRRVLKYDGVLFLNLGDSYAGGSRGGNSDVITGHGKDKSRIKGFATIKSKRNAKRWGGGNLPATDGLKPKDLIGIPWRVAFALQADGWWLRSDIIWSKPNPMPESVTDRPTKAHEYVFLLTKNARYYYDAKAILEPASYDGRNDTKFKGSTKYKGSWQTFAERGHERWPNTIDTKYTENQAENMGGAGSNWVGHSAYHGADGRELFHRDSDGIPARNKRSVWTVNTQPTSYAHFATFPEKLVEPCILAGSRLGDVILDPFAGSGTTGIVARRLNRNFIGLDLSLTYLKDIARRRLQLTALDEWKNGIKAETDMSALPLF